MSRYRMTYTVDYELTGVDAEVGTTVEAEQRVWEDDYLAYPLRNRGGAVVIEAVLDNPEADRG